MAFDSFHGQLRPLLAWLEMSLRRVTSSGEIGRILALPINDKVRPPPANAGEERTFLTGGSRFGDRFQLLGELLRG
jgi:hypothetical protein